MLLTLIASASLIFSCAKDGEDGLPGPVGQTGQTGQTGNSNVKSETFTSNTSDWIHIGTNGQAGDGFSFLQFSSIITSDIANSGAVFVYVLSTGGGWIALPASFTKSAWTENWRYAYSSLQLVISKEDSDFNTLNPGIQTFKVVAISSTARIANPNVDYNDYEQVKAAFNLEE